MRFALLAEYFQRIEATSKRLEMFDIMAELFSETGAGDIDKAIYFCQEQLSPPFYGIDLGMSEKFLLKTIALAAEARTDKVQGMFEELGDLGLVAEELIRRDGSMSVEQVHAELMVIAETSGKGSADIKISLLANLLKGVSSLEARYITRFVMGRLRLGIGDPTILEALAHVEICRSNNVSLYAIPPQSMKKAEKLAVFDRIEKISSVLEAAEESAGSYFSDRTSPPKDDVRQNKLADLYFEQLLNLRRSVREPLERANNICSDLGRVAKIFKDEGIEAIRGFKINVGYPVRMALCERASSSAEIIQKATDKDAGINEVGVEAKYDGIRCQIHKDADRVEIFSRNLERMTHMFPDIVSATQSLPVDSIIFEGEALAYNEDTGELLPFQATMQRRRKHNVKSKADEFPLKVFAFELLYLEGEDYTQYEYDSRHIKLDEIIKQSRQPTIETALRIRTGDPDKIDELFNSYVETGLEGIIVKKLDAPYIAGARNNNWIKLKRSYRGELADTVDVCVIGYFLGKGARAKFGLGALLAAVYEQETDTFKSISRIGTGFTEQQLVEYKEMLDEIKLDHKHPRVDSDITPDVWVEPKYVLTVTADEITRSPNHTAGRDEGGQGYALRFPRAEGLPRSDKSATDANTVAEIIRMSEIQGQSRVR